MTEQGFGMREPRVLEGEILPPVKPVIRPDGNGQVLSNLFLTQFNHYYEVAPGTQEIIYIIEKEPPEDPWELLFEEIFRSGEAAWRGIKAFYDYRQMCRQQKALIDRVGSDACGN